MEVRAVRTSPTARNMKTQSMIQNIKQEVDYETATNMETQSLIPSGELKHEPDYESQTVKKEANEEEESNISPVIRSSTSSPSLTCPEENCFLYCEKCQLKYEGGCPEHGAVIYVDNAEEGQGEGYGQDPSPQVQVVDSKDRQVLGREKVEQSKVCEAHSDDVRIIPNGGCSTESDEMFSVCEMNTELCVAGTSCGVQNNVEMNTELCVASTSCQLENNFERNTELCVAGTSCGLHPIVVMNAGHYIDNSEKPFSCDVCGVGFVESRALKTHMRTHTGEKHYKCDVCGLGFTRQGDLKIHKRTHTGEKPYKCDLCNAGFTEKSSINTHIKTHTGEKPYKCDVCGSGFTQQGHLKIHTRTHTGEKAESDEDHQPPSKIRQVIPHQSQPTQSSGIKHLPKMMDQKSSSRCRNHECSGKTKVQCTGCKMYLCLKVERNCFFDYHSK